MVKERKAGRERELVRGIIITRDMLSFHLQYDSHVTIQSPIIYKLTANIWLRNTPNMALCRRS